MHENNLANIYMGEKIMKYIKKPIVVEAIQYVSHPNEFYNELLGFSGGNRIVHLDNSDIFILTLEGKMKVSFGDYVIRGINGEIYPCKPDIFLKTYEVLEGSG